MIEQRSGVYPEFDIIIVFPIIGTECPDYFPDRYILASLVASSIKSL